MKAGKTNFDVNTRVQVTESTDKELIGITGLVTHPFNGLMASGVDYIAGLYVDIDVSKPSPFRKICNLIKGDIIKEIE